ncbi:formate dehydrogenase beta subunit, partial [Mesorhizobium sp. M7A.F.Ca.US.003.02.2.1]
MIPRIYIPGDSGALALGAEKVAKAIAGELAERGIEAKIVRNGSRGAYFLEPMVEVATANGRIAYGPVKPSDVKSLFDSGFLTGGHHKRWLGAPDKIPFLAKQTRLTFARCGVTDPLSLESYKKHGGLNGLMNALALTPAA